MHSKHLKHFLHSGMWSRRFMEPARMHIPLKLAGLSDSETQASDDEVFHRLLTNCKKEKKRRIGERCKSWNPTREKKLGRTPRQFR